MKHMSSRIGIMVATVGLAVAVGPSAYAGPHPLTVRIPSLVPDPGGYLYCRVVATSTTPIGIVAAIMSSNGTNVTEFGSGFRASPAATGDGLYYAEETAIRIERRQRHVHVPPPGTGHGRRSMRMATPRPRSK